MNTQENVQQNEQGENGEVLETAQGETASTENPIVKRVIGVVAEQLGVNEGDIKPTSNFTDDLGADSLDAVELVMALEDEFELEIPDEDADKFKIVQDAISYLTGRVSARNEKL